MLPLSLTNDKGHKEMLVRDGDNIDKYSLHFFSPMGSTIFTGTTNEHLIHFHGDYNHEKLDLSCTKSTKGHYMTVDFKVSEKSGGLSDLFSSSSNSYENNWNLYLKKNKNAKLFLSFGYGDASVNLSQLSVSRLKVDNLQADLRFNYSIGQANEIKMDTLKISSEFGSITFDGLELSRAKYASIDNAYGTTTININGKPTHRLVTNIYVGTGEVFVNLPKGDVPVKVVLKEKHLVTMDLPESFDKTSGRIYENKAYQKSTIDPLVFNLYGSVGDVKFQIKP